MPKSCCLPWLPSFMRVPAEPWLMVTLVVIHGNAGGSDSVGLYFWLNFSFTLDEINLWGNLKLETQAILQAWTTPMP